MKSIPLVLRYGYRFWFFLQGFYYAWKEVRGDKGGCLFASLDGSSLVTILFWKLVRSCFFVEEREAGSNLSRWQRKQVIWKKNLSYSDEWTTVEEEETHVACCLPFRTAFQFFQGLLGVKDGWPTGICRWSFPGRQRTILLNLATQVAHITQFNLAS